MVGAVGWSLRETRNGARLYEGPRGAHGDMHAEARPKWCPQVGGPKRHRGPKSGGL